MNIDFHVHTAERSACATSYQTEQIETAIASHLDAIAITDHHRLVPPAELAELNRRYAPFQIFTGVEITTDDEDWLVLGLNDDELESTHWSYPELHRFVRSRGGVIVLAHPFRFHTDFAVDLSAYPPDAIEIRSNNIRADLVPQIRALASQLHLPTLCDSDAHTTGSLGYYYNIFNHNASTEAEILAALRSGDVQHSIK